MTRKILQSFFIFILSCAYAESYSIFFNEGLCGVIDEKRKIVLDANYIRIEKNQKNYFLCEKQNSAYDFYSPDIKLIYQLPENSSARAYSNSEYQIYYWDDKKNSNLREILNIETLSRYECRKYEDLVRQPFYWEDDMTVVIRVVDGPSLSVVDRNENVLVSNIKQAGSNYHEGVLPVIFNNGRSGYINKKGKIVIKTFLYEDSRWETGKIDSILNYNFSEGVAFFQKAKDEWCIIDKKGKVKELPENIIFTTRLFINGLTVIEDKNHRYGYMNKKLEIQIPCIFDKAKSFINDYAAVVYNGKDAIIDSKGNIFYCKDLK